jgi:hypothetical protein
LNNWATWTLNFTGPAGTYTARVRATDVAGNQTVVSAQVTQM